MDTPSRPAAAPPAPRPRARRLALISVLAAALALLPALALPAAAATSTDYLSNCDVNLRATPDLTAGVIDVIATGVLVSVDSVVSGDAWSAPCPGDVGGNTWLRITAVGGKTTSDLYGAGVVYAAAGLFTMSTVLEGIDVSHWQGAIDWAKVARAGKRFVVAKVSEGIDFTDPRWASYRKNAAAAGLAVTGYHFARPDANPTQPRQEAAWFASQLGLAPGMLVPALDLERSGGMSVADLTAWVQAWLDEVYTRTGIRPMVYTSPSFWKRYLGDTRTFADQGYTVLWVAHWFVNAPSVPASNWGGKGWTFWQYDDCGRISGIDGCVDLDRYKGTDLTRVTFGADFSLSAAASSGARLAASTSGGASVKQGATTSFDVAIERTFFTLPVSLSVTGLPPGASATIGPSPTGGDTATLTISTSKSGTVTPTGTYALGVTGTANGLTRTTTATLVVTDGIAPVAKAPLSKLYAVTTLGTSTSPTRTSWSATDAKGVTGYTLQRQVNGGAWSTVGLPSVTATSLSQSLSLWTDYRFRVRATDAAGNASSWAYAATFSVRRTEQTHTAVRYSGTWKASSSSSASGGSTKYTISKGASATLTFSGFGIAWVAPRSAARGKADVYIDGVWKATVNLYASSFEARRIVFAASWSTSGTHTIRIVNKATPGHPRIDVDAFLRLAAA